MVVGNEVVGKTKSHWRRGLSLAKEREAEIGGVFAALRRV